MKYSILILLCFSVICIACKKDGVPANPSDAPPPTNTLINVDDPNAISNALKIFHSERVKGAIPKKTSSSPVLDPASNGQQFYAVPGGYVAIKPSILSGTANGYYFKIKGADSYFKIDYSKPRGGRMKSSPSEYSQGLLPGLSAIAAKEGDADSLIILQIPDSITAGTFCTYYYLRDDQDNISDSIEACITITHKGSATGGNQFTGTWKYSGFKSDTNQWNRNIYDTVKYSKGNRYCNADTLSYVCPPGNCPEIPVMDMFTLTTVYDLVFNDDGSFFQDFRQTEGQMNEQRSTCYQLAFDTTERNVKTPGIWSYEEATNTLILIFETNINGHEATRFWEYKIIENTGTHLLISYTNPYDVWSIEMDKK